MGDEIGRDDAPQTLDVGNDIAPQERRRRITVHEHDRVALADFDVGHLGVDDADGVSAAFGLDLTSRHKQVARDIRTIEDNSCTQDDIMNLGAELWSLLQSGAVEDAIADARYRCRERQGVLKLRLALAPVLVWALLTGQDDYSVAVGEAVAAGWDTDCNGATVGGLWGLQGHAIPEHWTRPWQGRVAVTLAGMDELPLDELVERTVRVAETLT